MECKNIPSVHSQPPPPPYTPSSTATDTVDPKIFGNEDFVPNELPPPYSSLCATIPDGQEERQPFAVVRQPQSEQTVVVMCPVKLGMRSASMICPACQMDISTVTETEAGNGTMTCAVIICCCIGLPCAFIPFCMDACLDTIHKCPNCKLVIGKHLYEPFGKV